MDVPCILPALQHRLVAAQAADDPLSALTDALQCGGVRQSAGGNPTAPLHNLLLAHHSPATVLAAAAYASGHPCSLGVLLARLLSCSIVHVSQLLAALPAAEWAAAITSLHSAANTGTLPQPSRSAAGQAFTTLVKALLTSGTSSIQQPGPHHPQQQQQPLQQLRLAWAGPAATGGKGAAEGTATPSDEGAALLAAVVAVIDREVFPRFLGRR